MSGSMIQTADNQRRRFSPARLAAALGLGAILLAIFSITIIETGQTGVMIRSGSDQARVLATPGVYLRLPFFERVWLIDMRLKTTEQTEAQLYTTGDKQSLRLSGWIAWRVTDPIQFQAAGADKSPVDDKLRKALGAVLTTWVAGQQSVVVLKIQANEMSRVLLSGLNHQLSSLGLEAIQVGLRQAELSESATNVIYARMSASKTRNARQLMDGLAADERQLVTTLGRQQMQVIDEAYRAAQQIRQRADQQLLAEYVRRYGSAGEFAEVLRNLPRPAGKSVN